MSLARPHDVAVLFAASLLVVLTAAPGADGACNATCQRDVVRCIATQCGPVAGAFLQPRPRVGREACRRRCKPAAIRTLAYVLSECRVDAAGFVVARQALRIRRGDREPITVVEFPTAEPRPDPLGLCRAYGEGRNGPGSMVVGALQRLGVSPDGSGVVFEVNDEFSIFRLTSLSPERKGIFFVRSDGRGLRRLGAASREASFRFGQDPTGALNVQYEPRMSFSPNGRRIAFTDLGPGPGGEEAVQIVVLDLATGRRTQVTRLPSGSPPGVLPSFLTAYPTFIDNETVLFFTFVDPDGSNPKHDGAVFTVRIDGSRLKRRTFPGPVAAPGSHVVPIFGVSLLPSNVVSLIVTGTPVNPYPGVDSIVEVFLKDRKNLLQLTNFHRVDTAGLFLTVTRTRAFFKASGDPFGTNPYENCQMFSIGIFGGGLRQVTDFNPGAPSGGCLFPPPSGCSVGFQIVVQDPVTKAVVFDSACDPLGANRFGYQLFAMRPDGLGLRQLTDAAGFTTNPDGSIRVELPGPFAYSTGLR